MLQSIQQNLAPLDNGSANSSEDLAQPTAQPTATATANSASGPSQLPEPPVKKARVPFQSQPLIKPEPTANKKGLRGLEMVKMETVKGEASVLDKEEEDGVRDCAVQGKDGLQWGIEKNELDKSTGKERLPQQTRQQAVLQ